MVSRFHCLRFGTIGLLFSCLAIAILGTGMADYLLRWEDARRRESLRQSVNLEKSFANFGQMRMDPDLFPPMAISVGFPAPFSAMKANPPMLIAKPFPVGSPAPDFTLPDALDQHPVHLADFRNKKPVVLLFGSFGCDIFCSQLTRLNHLHQAYKDRVEFLFVYIREGPHPVLPPSAQIGENLGHIPRGLHHFKVAFPCLLGNKDVEKAYAPYPLRLLIVGRDGRIALDAGLGIPRGWDFDGIESWLEAVGRIPADAAPEETPDNSFPGVSSE